MSCARVTLSMLGSLAVIALAPRPGAGQTCTAVIPAGSCTASTTTTMTAGTLLQLAVSASATTLAPPTTAGYDAGFVADNGPVTTVKCNRSWTLKIAAGAALWTASNTTPST